MGRARRTTQSVTVGGEGGSQLGHERDRSRPAAHARAAGAAGLPDRHHRRWLHRRGLQIPAYQAAGYNPVAIASRTPDHARAVAERHGIADVHDTWQQLLADPSVEVARRRRAARRAARDRAARPCKRQHIKGILAQKPLAMTVREARECVELCARGRHRAGGQPEHALRPVGARAEGRCSTAAELGEPVLATIDMRAIPHWMPWSQGLPSLSTFDHEHPPPRHVPLLASARPSASWPARAPTRARSSRTATASTSTSSSTTAACAPRPGTTCGPGRRARAPRATSASAGASRGPRAWPAARSAGRATRRPTPSTLASPTSKHPGLCSSRAGRRCGSPTPSRHDGRAVRALNGGENLLTGRRQPPHDGPGRGRLPLAGREARRPHRRDHG